jgi:hypothetical protein
MVDFAIGYGKGEIEPNIASLVQAIRDAGFVTFSSCEGHEDPDQSSLIRLPCVAFYADADRAKGVHKSLVVLRDRLACSWVLCGGFVAPREHTDWVLGWTLENGGVIDPGEGETFVKRTLEAARTHDIPLLSEMFRSGSSEPVPR